MTRSTFDAVLKDLHLSIIQMGDLVDSQIKKSVKALVDQDEKLANEVIKNDDLIDNLQKEIEDKCVKSIAREQPLAKDLRFIFTTIKIVTDLERMADHAVDIAKICKHLIGEKYIKELIDIPRMSLLISDLLKKSIDAYIVADPKKAKETAKLDDNIDNIYKQVFSELLVIMMGSPQTIKQASQFLFIGKYLERIADHATNICESTIYLATGEVVDLNE